MTQSELLDAASTFMLAHYGRPLDLEPEQREHWYVTLGLLVHFISTITNKENSDAREESRAPS